MRANKKLTLNPRHREAEMINDHLTNLRTTAQNKIGDGIYRDAAQTEQQLREFGDAAAFSTGCRAIYGPLKSRGRAEEKIADRLGGDWYELRDAVRMTLVAPDLGAVRATQVYIRTHAVAHQGLGIIRDFELTPNQSPCGYSGVNFALRLQNGRIGEIQVNIPTVMYGQLDQSIFTAALSPAEHRGIRQQKGVDGGLGHGFYEIYRMGKNTESGKQAAELSRRYFDCLRGHSGLQIQRTLAADLQFFVNTYPAVFKH